MSENKNFEIGQTVRGIVTGCNSSAIYLEIEEGVRGVIYAKDILNCPDKLYEEYSEGSEFSAQIKSISKDKKDPNVVLLYLSTTMEKEKEEREAKTKALEEKIAEFKKLKDDDEIIEAKLVSVNKGIATLTYNNMRISLSQKYCSLSEEALKKMKGELIPIIIIYVNEEHRIISGSQIAAEKKARRLAKEKAYAAIEVGQVYEGEVKNLLDYGAVVAFADVTGLLHVSELDHKPVKDVKSVLKVGQKLNVKVIKINGDKISLSVKALTKHPWEVLKEQYHVGDVFEGKVVKHIPAGLLIELTADYSGLMPNSEYSWFKTDHVEDVADDAMLTVKVLSIDDEKKRVSLSHKATMENTWGDVKLRKGQTITVKVISLEEKGATVKYENIEGFLPVNEVTASKRVSSVGEMYPLDSEVNVMVTDFDPKRARLIVSSKALELAKERETFDSYMKNQDSEDTKVTLGDVFKDFEKEDK